MQDPFIECTLRGKPMQFHTTWGLFSPKKIDDGSLLLIKNIQVDPKDHILDLGCGYGPIGLSLAKDAPAGEVHLVDKDFIAIEYAKKNAKANKIRNAKCYLSNGLKQVPPKQKFNIIVSNIPAKVGKELLSIFLEDCKKSLKKDGRIYFVTIAGLKEFMKRNLKEHFGNYKKIAQSKGYVVSMASKE